jgi:hypothetical protein
MGDTADEKTINSKEMKHSLTEGLIILSLVILFWGIGLRMMEVLAYGNMMIVAGAALFGVNYYRRFVKK